jgi:peptide/nickel transport system substrate-binding protein
MMQQMLKEVGININIEQSEFGTFMEAIGKGNFKLFSLSRNGVQDPDYLYNILYSKNTPPEGQNRGYYSNPRVDELLLQGRTTFDRAKRKPIYDEVQKLVQQDLPYLSLYHQLNAAVTRKNIDGYVPYPAGFLLSVPQMSIH